MRRSTRLEGRPIVNFDESDAEDGDGLQETVEVKRKYHLPSPPLSNGNGGQNEDEDEEYSEDSSPKGSKKRKASAKGKAKAITSPKKQKTTKDAKPPRTDPATWRESKFAEDATITKGDALKQYRLKSADLSHLKPTRHRTKAGYDSLLYRTREIEHIAWSKHGSPEAFEVYIAKLRAQHEKKNTNSPQKTEFIEPQPDVDKFDVIAKKYDMEMASLEKEFPPWLWKYLMSHCKKMLPRCDEYGIYYGGHELQEKGEILEKLRVAKKQNLHDSYPRRPTGPAPDSPSFIALKELLDDAPGLGGFDWYDPPEGIVTHEDYEGYQSHDWTHEFKQEVNDAMDAARD
ncbi:hypothetical protein SCHPADRAFT_942938 [Schizopora paradoxa]|uniref:Uncharacterized protein n=1 Tax=Schizopora paradoxa TaxID=27342 RepID=A0A0H2RLK8_9AGAM|nr:hypothetical protein SCHPADRAFT_942938 [Schizopora paradoxa]